MGASPAKQISKQPKVLESLSTETIESLNKYVIMCLKYEAMGSMKREGYRKGIYAKFYKDCGQSEVMVANQFIDIVINFRNLK